MRASPIVDESVRIAAGFFACLVLAAVAGHFWLWLVIGLLSYLAWHLFNLNKLLLWLRDPRQPLPTAAGLWASVFDALYRQRKSNQARIRRLKRGLDLFEETATALPDATVILGIHNTIEWCNEAAERLLGLRKPVDYGQRIDNLFRHPSFIDYLGARSYEGVIEVPSPVEESIMLRLQIVEYGARRRLLLARNVSRLHRLNQVRSDFIANVSHELRTPLTVINGLVEMLYEKSQQHGDAQLQPLSSIKSQSERMLRLIDDLLFLSRLETETTAASKKPVDVPALLARLAEEVQLLSGEQQHRIEFDVDSQLQIQGDSNELYSAFSNLLVNAVKYTPARGLIRVRWSQTEAGAELSVQDTGIGIEAPKIPRLTERFYRVDVGRSREQGGTGLGLAIVKHVLVRHNARLSIDSRPGEGSVFRCVFPAALIRRR